MSTDDDNDDLRAFRDAMAGARPLKSDRAPQAKDRPAPRARLTPGDHGDPDPGPSGTGEELFYARAGVAKKVLRKLKRGAIAVAGEMDLHGLNAVAARIVFDEFMLEAAQRRWNCVRIVTGKGKRSGHAGPVLKPKVARWLTQRAEVLAYSTARPADGGSGALYVLLAHS